MMVDLKKDIEPGSADIRPVVTRDMWRRSDEADGKDVESRVAALESENAQLKEALDLLLSGATEEAAGNG